MILLNENNKSNIKNFFNDFRLNLSINLVKIK